MALYETEFSQKQIDERSFSIDELNESIKAISSALNDEDSTGRRGKEEYSHEAEQLNQGY